MMNMANAIAAGVKVSATEIPQMSEAILQVGAVSKEAGLNINELNATLQAMAVGGKYGAEAGTVLRNILTKMQGMAGEREWSKYGSRQLHSERLVCQRCRTKVSPRHFTRF